MVESKRMKTGRPWNNQRLFFLISSARHFAKELEVAGFEVHYKKSSYTPTGLKAIMKETGIKQLVCGEPSSFVQYGQLIELGAEFVENDFFLTSRTLFTAWAETQKTFLIENFYRKQRGRLGILVKDGKPEGDVWNFDEDNRLPPPKNYSWDEYLETTPDATDKEVAKELGMAASPYWETTRAGALKRLKLFVDQHLKEFGPYEDADKSIPRDGIYLLELHGSAEAFIWLDDIDGLELRGFVVRLGVKKDHQGKGFGQLLLGTALAHFSRRGYVHAELGVDTENASNALRVYEKLGFTVLSADVEHERPVTLP
jgi:ribosomal protein S18 acetylase RimI-like enzyme